VSIETKYRDLDKKYREVQKELKEVRAALYKVSKDLELNQINKNNLAWCLHNIINSSDWWVDKIKEQCSSYLESFGKYINPDNKLKVFKELNEKYGCKSFGWL